MVPDLPEELLTLIFGYLEVPIFLEDTWELYQLKSAPHHDRVTIRLRTLRNVCLASRRLNRLASPILYRGYTSRELPAVDEQRWVGGESRQVRRPAVKLETFRLLWTLCLKPDLGRKIRSLSLGPWALIGDTSPVDRMSHILDDATCALFQWTAKGFWAEHAVGHSSRYWIWSNFEHLLSDDSVSTAFLRALNLGFPDAYMVMLLIMCPNVRELDISPPQHFESSLFSMLLKLECAAAAAASPRGTLPGATNGQKQKEIECIATKGFGAPLPGEPAYKPRVLQYLRKLHIYGLGLTDLTLSFFNGLLALPSLQSLLVHGLRGVYEGSVETLTPYTTSSQLTMLDLISCQLRTSELVAIVQCCPKLRVLEVEWDLDEMDGDHNLTNVVPLQFGRIGSAVSQFAPEMRKLSLGASEWPTDAPSMESPSTMGNALQDLTELEELNLDYDGVYDMEVESFRTSLSGLVPKSVKTLEIRPPCSFEKVSWQQWQTEDLSDFLQNDAFKDLETVEIYARCAGPLSTDVKSALEKRGWDVDYRSDTWYFAWDAPVEDDSDDSDVASDEDLSSEQSISEGQLSEPMEQG